MPQFQNSTLFQIVILKPTHQYQKTVYIQANASIDGDGSLNIPYKSLISAFIQESANMIQYLQSNITLVLIGTTHYILRQDVPFDGYYFFRRVFADITIKPLFCSDFIWPGCLNSYETLNIYIKTDAFYIFITKGLSLNSLNFIAIDLPLQTGNDINAAYNLPITQCRSNDLTAVYGSSLCGLKNGNITMTAFRSILSRYALINLERRIDDQNSSNIVNLQIILQF